MQIIEHSLHIGIHKEMETVYLMSNGFVMMC